MATIFPDRYSMDPFPLAMEKLLAGRSQRAFAKKVPMHQMTLSRLMRGQYEPDLEMLERIAKAAKVTPAYFLEWRAEYISRVLSNVFRQRPNLSVAALQLLLEQS
jgi:transcriptional regulator with XRE-family HTH domain